MLEFGESTTLNVPERENQISHKKRRGGGGGRGEKSGRLGGEGENKPLQAGKSKPGREKVGTATGSKK